jgi:hypothetical protein
MHTGVVPAAIAATACVWLTLAAGAANGPKFYRDDPIARDPETQDASGVKPSELSELYDFAENSFLGAGEKADKRAVNVNTIDDVPDSSWFTNRLGREPWTADRLAKGPDTGSGPSGRSCPAKWRGVRLGSRSAMPPDSSTSSSSTRRRIRRWRAAPR